MKTHNNFLLLAALSLSLLSVNSQAETAANLIKKAPYSTLYGALKPNVPALTTLVNGAVNQINYGKLVTFARKLEAKLPGSRVTITLPDGTAVFDGGKTDDPGNTLKQGNSYNHYQTKTITENLNTRLSNLNAQLSPDGLGAHLDNSGTARISIKK